MTKEKMTDMQRMTFCKLLEDAMEGRSYAEYAKASGVSASNITRIKKSEYRPHQDMLMKLTSESANPANGVTFAMLSQAVGYGGTTLVVPQLRNKFFVENVEKTTDDLAELQQWLQTGNEIITNAEKSMKQLRTLARTDGDVVSKSAMFEVLEKYYKNKPKNKSDEVVNWVIDKIREDIDELYAI